MCAPITFEITKHGSIREFGTTLEWKPDIPDGFQFKHGELCPIVGEFANDPVLDAYLHEAWCEDARQAWPKVNAWHISSAYSSKEFAMIL